MPAALARPRDVEYAILQEFGHQELLSGRITIDLPRHSDAGTSVPLTVSVDSPMTADDYVKAIHVYADDNPRPKVLAIYFTPQSGRAELNTRIRLDGSQTVTAVAEMSTGELYQSNFDIGVTYGACSDLSGGPVPEVEADPQRRVSVPETAKAGEIVNVRTLISHPMENGFRLDENDTWVPLRIIESLTVADDSGTRITRIKLEPAISTNPYMAFYLRAEKSTTLHFTWLDTTGAVYASEAHMKVA